LLASEGGYAYALLRERPEKGTWKAEADEMPRVKKLNVRVEREPRDRRRSFVPILLHANHEHVWLISAVWYYHAVPRLNGRQAEKALG